MHGPGLAWTRASAAPFSRRESPHARSIATEYSSVKTLFGIEGETWVWIDRFVAIFTIARLVARQNVFSHSTRTERTIMTLACIPLLLCDFRMIPSNLYDTTHAVWHTLIFTSGYMRAVSFTGQVDGASKM